MSRFGPNPISFEDLERISTEKQISGVLKEDKKYDTGKPMTGLMKKDFSKALMAVAEITRYGVEKYNQPGSWRLVEDALRRYEDALGRHDLLQNSENYDKESGYLHAAHRAWNALATLELILEKESLNNE